jgi:hypothetical protein
MTTLCAEFRAKASPERIECRRAVRLIAIGSASLTGLIALVAGVLAFLA